MKRAVLWGTIAGLLVVAGVAGFAVAKARSGGGDMERLGDAVFVVVAGRGGSDQSQVAQLAGVVRTGGGVLDVELADPLSTATVPGTTYDKLRDAYSFGGGVGVEQAWERARNVPAVPVITVSEAGFTSMVDRMGGLDATVPVDMNVFDGTRLFTLPAGRRHLSGAEAMALLGGLEYVRDRAVRNETRRSLVSALGSGAATHPFDLRDLVTARRVTSTLKAADVERWAALVRGRLRSASVTEAP